MKDTQINEMIATITELTNRVNQGTTDLQEAAKREATLLEALRQYADADQWVYGDVCLVGRFVAMNAIAFVQVTA